MRITTYGMWHLGCVTAACLAEAGHDVVGLDPDVGAIDDLRQGKPPLHEPGLVDLIRSGMEASKLRFTNSPDDALREAEVLWATFDMPVNEQDEADVASVRKNLEAVANYLPRGALVLISSQVPAGFTRSLEDNWRDRGVRFAVSPENLRLGKALDAFRHPERVVVGVRDEAGKATLSQIFGRFTERIEWMSIESAEMTKHALNAFLATSVTFINEIARICEVVGADAREVERGLKSEARIGPKAYLSPGAAFAGGTLARDVRFLVQHGRTHHVGTPLFEGVIGSNDVHKNWTCEHVSRLLANDNANKPVVAVLGLTYKPGTSTLRRSSSVELCRWLHSQGVAVQAHDPTVAELPIELRPMLRLTATPQDALDGADIAVVATEWPAFRSLIAEEFRTRMNRPRVIDPSHFLAKELRDAAGITYVATGRAA